MITGFLLILDLLLTCVLGFDFSVKDYLLSCVLLKYTGTQIRVSVFRFSFLWDLFGAKRGQIRERFGMYLLPLSPHPHIEVSRQHFLTKFGAVSLNVHSFYEKC